MSGADGLHTLGRWTSDNFKVVAISDVTGAYYKPDGLDIPDVLHYMITHNMQLKGYVNAERITNAELLELDVDVLIPAALGGVITDENAARISAKVIIEGANGPVTPDADALLHDRGVVILPDILANAGGVTVSYFEWVQNLQYYKWGLNRVRQELDHVLTQAFEEVYRESQERNVSLRTAAYMIAVTRVYRAAQLAGLS